jgi:hypothetical protein
VKTFFRADPEKKKPERKAKTVENFMNFYESSHMPEAHIVPSRGFLRQRWFKESIKGGLETERRLFFHVNSMGYVIHAVNAN